MKVLLAHQEIRAIGRTVGIRRSPTASQMLPLAYNECCKLASEGMAQEKLGQMLAVTAFVHEAYLGLVSKQNGNRWNSRGHFRDAITIEQAAEDGLLPNLSLTMTSSSRAALALLRLLCLQVLFASSSFESR
jgi:hypothetical protein